MFYNFETLGFGKSNTHKINLNILVELLLCSNICDVRLIMQKKLCKRKKISLCKNLCKIIYHRFISYFWNIVILGAIAHNFYLLLNDGKKDIFFFKIVVIINSFVLRQIAKYDVQDPRSQLKLNLWNFKSFILYEITINLLSKSHVSTFSIVILLLGVAQSFVEYICFSCKPLSETQEELAAIALS